MFRDVAELSEYLSVNAHKWRADSWKQMWDAVSYPAKAQAVFDGTYDPPDGCDCDEFAIFICNSVERGLATGAMKAGEVSNPKFVTIVWLEGWRATGHNVCLVTLADGKLAYLDYGLPIAPSATVSELTQKVVSRYASKDATPATLVCWAVQRSDLTPEEVGFSK